MLHFNEVDCRALRLSVFFRQKMEKKGCGTVRL